MLSTFMPKQLKFHPMLVSGLAEIEFQSWVKQVRIDSTLPWFKPLETSQLCLNLWPLTSPSNLSRLVIGH